MDLQLLRNKVAMQYYTYIIDKADSNAMGCYFLRKGFAAKSEGGFFNPPTLLLLLPLLAMLCNAEQVK
jgi:hypothetical protein